MRVTTLVGWRLAAMWLYAFAVLGRVTHGGWSRLEADGRQLSDWVGSVPGAQVLQIPGEVVSAIGTPASLLAGPFHAVPAVSARRRLPRGGGGPPRSPPLARG